MAEVRSKMSDVKSQVLEARGFGEPRPGLSGAFGVEEMPSHHPDPELLACHKPSDLDLLAKAAMARSRHYRPGEPLYITAAEGDSFTVCCRILFSQNEHCRYELSFLFSFI